MEDRAGGMYERAAEEAAEKVARTAVDETAGMAAKHLLGRAFVGYGVYEASKNLPKCIEKLKVARLCDTEQECGYREGVEDLWPYLPAPSGAFN